MSYCNLSVMNPCENLQGQLTNYFNTCNAVALREPMPFFDFLNSDVNNFGLNQVVSPGNGKVRTINLKYRKRYPESQVNRNVANPLCSATGKPSDCIESYTIDPGVNWNEGSVFSATEFRNVCEDNGSIFAGEVQLLMDVVMRKMATDITANAVALLGRWNTNVAGWATVAGGDELQLQTLKSVASGDINPTFYEDLDLATIQTGYCSTRYVFGGSTPVKYFRRASVAGCCANQGLNIDDVYNNYGMAVYYDERVRTAMGANGENFGWVVQPGSLALLTYNQFAGNGVDFAGISTGTNYQHAVVLDPKTGFPFDLSIKDDCGVISVNITATAKVVALPFDLFPVGDPNFGVKYFNKFRIVNA